MTCSNDLNLLATVSLDDIRVWNLTDHRVMAEIHIGTEHAEAVGFSPNGKLIAVGTKHGRVEIFDTASGLRVTDPLVLEAPVCSVRFSHTGHSIAVGGEQGRLRLWDIPSFLPLGPAFSLRWKDRVKMIRFTADETTLFTLIEGNHEKSLWRWHLPSPVQANTVEEKRKLREAIERRTGIRWSRQGEMDRMTELPIQ